MTTNIWRLRAVLLGSVCQPALVAYTSPQRYEIRGIPDADTQ